MYSGQRIQRRLAAQEECQLIASWRQVSSRSSGAASELAAFYVVVTFLFHCVGMCVLFVFSGESRKLSIHN